MARRRTRASWSPRGGGGGVIQRQLSFLAESGDGNLLPPLSDEEYQALKADIAARGEIMVPVEYDQDGTTLDGHHRVRAWNELKAEGVPVKDYPRVVRRFADEDERVHHALVLNLARRHLTPVQRGQLVLDLKRRGWTNTAIADVLDVSHDTVRDISQPIYEDSYIGTVMRRNGRPYPARLGARRPAILATTPAEFERAKTAIQDTDAAAIPDKWLPLKRIERIAREEAAKGRAARNVEPIMVLGAGAIELRLGDFREVLADVPDGSIDAIITDPPYGAAHLDVWCPLGVLAARVLRPGGILATYSGQTYLPAVIGALAESLTYLWTIAVVGRGQKSIIRPVRFYSRWKPVFVFAKPPHDREEGEWTDDVFTGSGPDKAWHDWQQGEDEAGWLVDAFSAPGARILDPFVGGGTTLAAALLLGRQALGCDVDPVALGQARERVNDLS